MSKPLTSTFLITLVCSDSKSTLKDNLIRPSQSNLLPLEIRIRRSVNKKDLNAQKCKYIPVNEFEYAEDTRCYIQIWELDSWMEETKKKKKKVKAEGKDKDIEVASDKAKKNDFLAEFGGFIKEIKKGRQYKFVTDDKGITIQKAPTDKKLGKLLLRIEQQDNENFIKKDYSVPIQGEAENILEIGIVYQDTPNQQSYTDNYNRPIYHLRNISKIIQEQLDGGGLRLVCYTQYNRNIDKKDLAVYNKGVEKKTIPAMTEADKEELKNNKNSLNEWLVKLKNSKPPRLKTDIPKTYSDHSIYKIKNDANFPYASGKLSKEFNSLYINSKDEIDVGCLEILEWRKIINGTNALIDAVYKQHLGSLGEKPKVSKLAIYCHGEPNMLLTAGRRPEQEGLKKIAGGDIILSKVKEFVKSFVIKEDKNEIKLLADDVVIALYACSAARSSYTDEGVAPKKRRPREDNTYGKKPPKDRLLGEKSIARALRDVLHADKVFPQACVYGHTTVGDADANPFIRMFCAGKDSDLTELKSKNWEERRDAMFKHPAAAAQPKK